MDYRYTILPSGNSEYFSSLDEELKKRKVVSWFSNTKSGGRIYRIDSSSIPLLPKDEDGYYLGDDASGWSFYPLADIDDLMNDLHCSDWVEIY